MTIESEHAGAGAESGAGLDGVEQHRTALMKALEHLGHAARPEAVHQVRIAARKLRSSLAMMLAAQADDRTTAALKAVKKVGRSLAPLRELDVSLGLTRELRRELETGEAADLRGLEALVKTLKRERRDARSEARKALRKRRKRLEKRLGALEPVSSASDAEGLEPTRADEADEAGTEDAERQDLAGGDSRSEAAGGAESAPGEGLPEAAVEQALDAASEAEAAMGADAKAESAAEAHPVKGAVLPGQLEWLEQMRRRLIDLLPTVQEEAPAAGKLHALRITVKKLRYALETLADEADAGLVGHLHNLQDQLGAHRDWSSLEDRVTRLHARLVQHERKPRIRVGLVALEPPLHRRVLSQLENVRVAAGLVAASLLTRGIGNTPEPPVEPETHAAPLEGSPIDSEGEGGAE